MTSQGHFKIRCAIPRVSTYRMAGPIVCLAAAGVLCGVPGCAALPLASLGTLSGIAFSAVSTGKDVYQLGKLDSAEMATMDEALQAARDAGADLGLQMKLDTLAADVGQLKFADDKNAGISVRIEQRSSMLVRTRIDVGIFGSEVTARLFLRRMRMHLPQTEPMPESTELPETITVRAD